MKTFSSLRAFALLAAFALILTSFSHAILDTNTNGMSDLWEKQHNNGNLFPASFIATADPDQDGWNNVTEAIAGTNPHHANMPDGMITTTIEPTGTEGAFTLTWPTIVGKNYRLQASSNLTNWLNVGTAIVGTTNSHTLGISAVQPDTTVPPKLFWRIVTGDLDADNDGVTNAEEFIAGTNELLGDTDSDGVNDFDELSDGTNPNNSDTDGDGANDGVENAQATDPNDVNSHPALFYQEEKAASYVFFNLQVLQYLDDPPAPYGYIDSGYSWAENEAPGHAITSKVNLKDIVGILPTVNFPLEPQRSVGSFGIDMAQAHSSAIITPLDEGEPNDYYAQAYLTHQHIWFKRSTVQPSSIATKILITKSRRVFDGEDLQSELNTEYQTLTIPSNGLVSNVLKLEPSLETEHSEPGTHHEHYGIVPMPIIVRDGNKVINSMPFVQDPWANSQLQSEVSPDSIAWITGNTGPNNSPEMPKLSVELSNGRSDIMVSWRFECAYKRGNGYRESYISDFTQEDDLVKIPANGEYTVQKPGDARWNIFEELEWINELNTKGFFGGLAKIFLKIGTEEEVEVCRFRIGGRNPAPAIAREYINQIAGADFWYAHAIAKHETAGRVKENNATRYYNHFYTNFRSSKIGANAGDMSWVAWAQGWPLYNLDRKYSKKSGYSQNGPGGYGMFQLTLGPKKVNGDQTSQSFLSRDQIWNWQANCRRAIDELKDKKQKFAIPLINKLSSSFPNWPNIQNTHYKNFNAIEAATITYYNGMSGPKIETVAGKKSCWFPIKSGNNRKWLFLTNTNDYVDKINTLLEL